MPLATSRGQARPGQKPSSASCPRVTRAGPAQGGGAARRALAPLGVCTRLGGVDPELPMGPRVAQPPPRGPERPLLGLHVLSSKRRTELPAVCLHGGRARMPLGLVPGGSGCQSVGDSPPRSAAPCLLRDAHLWGRHGFHRSLHDMLCPIHRFSCVEPTTHSWEGPAWPSRTAFSSDDGLFASTLWKVSGAVPMRESAVSFPCDVFGWFRCQGNAGLAERVRKCSLRGAGAVPILWTRGRLRPVKPAVLGFAV